MSTPKYILDDVARVRTNYNEVILYLTSRYESTKLDDLLFDDLLQAGVIRDPVREYEELVSTRAEALREAALEVEAADLSLSNRLLEMADQIEGLEE